MSTPVIERQNVFEPMGHSETGLGLFEEGKEDLSKKAHIVTPADNVQLWNFLSAAVGRPITSQELVDIAREAGYEVVALCQYSWIPTERVGNHDACGACMAIAQQRMSEAGE